MTESR
jgi:hypothetical protein